MAFNAVGQILTILQVRKGCNTLDAVKRYQDTKLTPQLDQLQGHSCDLDLSSSLLTQISSTNS